MIQVFRLSLIFVFLLTCLAVPQVSAQTVGMPSVMTGETTPQLPDPLTPEAVRGLVSTLSDAQVRNLLLERLDAVATEHAAVAEAASGGLGSPAELATKFIDSIIYSISLAPLIPGDVRQVFMNAYYNAQNGLLSFAIVFAFAFGVGWLAERLVMKIAGLWYHTIHGMRPTTARGTLGVLGLRFCIYLLFLAAFVFGAWAASYLINMVLYGTSVTAEHYSLGTLILMVGVVRLAGMVAGFFLAPKRPELRLSHMDDWTAKFLTRQAMVMTFISSLFFIFFEWLIKFGLVPSHANLGFWFGLMLLINGIYTFWRAREGITNCMIGNDDSTTKFMIGLAKAWPYISIFLFTLQWVIMMLMVAVGNIAGIPQYAPHIAIALLFLIPIVDSLIRELVRRAYPVLEGDDKVQQKARKDTQNGLLRMARIGLIGFTLFLIARVWGINFADIAQAGFGATLAGKFFEVVLVVAIAYIIWELVDVLVNRKLALEKGDLEEDEESDEIGGAGASRIATVLPIIRGIIHTFIAIFTIITVLSSMNVNVTALLAGAGIIGLAVGFGAQTLVRDIMSGMFYLIDDAFRRGEYLDIGGTMGAVEKISLRSLRMRHHLGPVHTIPYGEITQLTNYSRDWVIVKLKFRVPFDTDIEKVRKLFKKIGQELLTHPVIGEDFLAPFKSQGVYDVDDTSIIVRGKFTAKPGKQFLIKREIYTCVQKAFDNNGIPFARKQVIVHVPGLETVNDDRVRQGLKGAAGAAADLSSQLPPASGGGSGPDM